MTIPVRYRLGLFAKGLLLLALALLFGALLARAALMPGGVIVLRLAGGIVFSVCAVFLGWTAALAFADAVLGRAVSVTGKALRSRRGGVSFRLSDGRSAEFLLYNPWEALVPEQQYALVVGRYSRVLVERPKVVA